jgi:hypothetical protein
VFDGGGDDDCVNDDSTSDSYGDTCTSWYDAMEGPGSSGCTGAYDDDDFNAAEQCCACQEGVFNNGHDGIVTPALSTDSMLNAKVFNREIATYKKSQKTLDKPVFATGTVIAYVDSHGDITYISNESNRLVSYDVAVSCDTCLGGGPWSGTFSSGGESELLVYGFDADSNACGSVTGISTEFGSTKESEAACANAGDQTACEFFDCSGAEACGYESWVGDGYCDDGTYGMYFDCDEFDCDAGDCLVDCWDGSSACGAANCPEEPQCGENDVNSDGQVNVTDIVFVVSVILGTNQTDPDECTDVNGDGQINVTDIVTIVNAILGGSARVDDATDATITVAGNLLSVDGNGFIQGIQLTLTHEGSINIDLENEYVADYRTIGNTTTLVVVTDGSHSLTDVATISGSYEITDAIVVNSQDEVQAQQVLEVASFELKAAYPNPFNPVTSLDLVVPEAGFVSVKVYNLMGQEVATLTEGMMQATSGYTLTWDASNMASGVYLVRAEGVGSVATQKLMLLK